MSLDLQSHALLGSSTCLISYKMATAPCEEVGMAVTEVKTGQRWWWGVEGG